MKEKLKETLMPFVLTSTERQDSSVDFAGDNSKKNRQCNPTPQVNKLRHLGKAGKTSHADDVAVKQTITAKLAQHLTQFVGDAKVEVITKPSVETQKQ